MIEWMSKLKPPIVVCNGSGFYYNWMELDVEMDGRSGAN